MDCLPRAVSAQHGGHMKFSPSKTEEWTRLGASHTAATYVDTMAIHHAGVALVPSGGQLNRVHRHPCHETGDIDCTRFRLSRRAHRLKSPSMLRLRLHARVQEDLHHDPTSAHHGACQHVPNEGQHHLTATKR